jgi:hypothetical protein
MTAASERGRPLNPQGARRKAALVSAWNVVMSLSAVVLAVRAKVSRAKWYALVDPARPHQPSVGVLRATAVMCRELSSRLASDATRLDRIADDNPDRRATTRKS